MGSVRVCGPERARAVAACMVLVHMLCGAMDAGGEDWPRWRGPRGDGTWRGPALPERWPAGGPSEVWRRPIGGGYAGVVVADGRVYTMDRQAEPERERVLCFAAATGEPLWAHAYDAPYAGLTYDSGPRAAPTVHDGRLYTLGAVGHVACLDAASGAVLWSFDAVARLQAVRPKWGFAAAPVVHGETVILHIGARPGGCLVALDRHTGQEAWRTSDDSAGYCTPTIVPHAGRALLLCWNPERLIGVSPEDGRLHWAIDYPIRYGVSIASPVHAGGVVFVSSFWHGARAIRLGAEPHMATVLWSDDMLRGLMSQPLYRDGHAYMLDRQFGVVCFELATGRKRWHDESPPVTRRERNPQASMVWLGDADQPGRAIILNALGELILARLTPDGYAEQSRARIIGETWAHPAYAGRHAYARDDHSLVCVALAPEGP